MRNGLLKRISSLGMSLTPGEEGTRPKKVIVDQYREKRASPRVNTYKDSTLFLAGNRKVRIVIHDMSETGLRIGCDSGHSLPDYVDVMVMGDRYNCRVVWRGTFEAGLEYLSLAA